MIPAWTVPYFPFSTLTQRKPFLCLSLEVVFINDILRHQAEFDLVVLIIRHWVVEVEVLDVNH